MFSKKDYFCFLRNYKYSKILKIQLIILFESWIFFLDFKFNRKICYMLKLLFLYIYFIKTKNSRKMTRTEYTSSIDDMLWFHVIIINLTGNLIVLGFRIVTTTSGIRLIYSIGRFLGMASKFNFIIRVMISIRVLSLFYCK